MTVWFTRFSNLFYTRSLFCVPAGQNPPTWCSQNCLGDPMSLFWIPSFPFGLTNVLGQERPDSRTRTARPGLCFEEVQELLVWNADNSLYWTFFSCFLGNPSWALWKKSSLDWYRLWVPYQDSLPKGSAQHCGWRLIQTRRLQTDQLSFCSKK